MYLTILGNLSLWSVISNESSFIAKSDTLKREDIKRKSYRYKFYHSINVNISLEMYIFIVSAIINENKNEVIGYITYSIDFYSSNVYRFGLFSFDRGNPNIGREVFNLLEELINKYHRLEFKAMSENPAVKGYDAFLDKHSDIGKKIVFKDIIKDADGNYHDEYVYEFINDKI